MCVRVRPPVPGDFLGLAALLDSLVLTQAFQGAGPMKPQERPFDLLLAHSLPWNRQFTCRCSAPEFEATYSVST